MTPKPNRGKQARNKQWQNQRMEVYAAMIDCVDQAIGRIMKSLEQAGVDDNTLVLFLSDNGSCAESPGGENNVEHVPGPKEFYSHVGPSWAHAQNAPFRRYKTKMHEGGIATPLIAHWPGTIPPDTMTDQVGHIIDLLPTFLDAAGEEYPEKFQGHSIRPAEGISLLSVLKSPDQTKSRSEPLFWGFAGNRGVRQGDWKLAWDSKRKQWELYDLVADRTEMDDLAGTYPKQVQAMAAAWRAWADEMDVRYAK